MPALPLSALSTIIVLLVYFALLVNVGRARVRYGIKAPATSGDVEFEKRFRVQMNSLEQIVILLPALWMCAFWVGDLYGGVGGLVWSIGRIIFARGYYADPEKRGLGFGLSVLSSMVMLVATAVAIVRAIL